MYEYMDMKYFKFKFFTLEHIDVFIFIKKMQNAIVLIKNCDLGIGLGLGLRVFRPESQGLRARGKEKVRIVFF